MDRSVTRRAVLAAAAGLAGCAGGGSAGGGTGGTGPPTSGVRLPLPDAPASLRDRVVSGGPPRDGIPAIDDPAFATPSTASTLPNPGAPVIGLAAGGEAKAYPQSILVHHEVCNDTIDGTPVSVTYCPLTGTALGFERGDTTFGVSGRLLNNNLVLYDRATETWWPQVLATSIPGPWNEDPGRRSLRERRVVWTTWERWVGAHPETQVLTRNTGYAKNYDRDPYGSYDPRRGYYVPTSPPLFSPLVDVERLPPKAVVLGARTPGGAIAVTKDRLRADGVVAGAAGDAPVVAVYDRALDTGYVYANPEDRTFGYRDGRVREPDGTTHDPAELPLARIHAFDAMWFAWRGFYPETTLHE